MMGDASAIDKERFLYRGAGNKALVGYVSAVLDNSDGRLTGVRTNRETPTMTGNVVLMTRELLRIS